MREEDNSGQSNSGRPWGKWFRQVFFRSRRSAVAGKWIAPLLAGFALLGIIGVAAGLGYLRWISQTTPELDRLEKLRGAQPSTIVAADGTALGEFRRHRQERVALEQISPHVIDALIATEDQRFVEHRGVDFRRTFAAAYYTLRGDEQGGSTITQQLARNVFPDQIGRTRSIERKLREMFTAMKIERAYSKQQILEIYLNNVPFLYNVRGIEMAARTYFNKSAAELDIAESAMLVGMLKGTHYYNPIANPERAKKRRNLVLKLMQRSGHINAGQYQALSATSLGAALHRQAEGFGAAPHFTMHVRRWLANWSARHGYDLYTDGLRVETTLDLAMQSAAERAVERQASKLQRIADVEWSQKNPGSSRSADHYAQRHKRIEPFRYFWDSQPEILDAFIRESRDYQAQLKSGKTPAAALAAIKADTDAMRRLRADKTRLEAGLVAMDPVSGEVKAWVGSRDFKTDQYDHVGQAVRQPGSTFKPFVYGAAMEMGISPRRSYTGGAVAIPLADGGVWRPTDMSATSGPMTLREGLIHSKNTITAQIMVDTGIPAVVDLAQAMGVRQSRLAPVMSLALGTSPVTLLEMVSAYSTIASAGTYRAPVVVKRITDRTGRVIAEFGDDAGQPVMTTRTAVELIDIMRDVVERGTAQQIKHRFNIAGDVAGKTGTTQYNTDGWFLLMHPQLVAGAWVGFNDQRVTMRSDYWGQGGHNAILLVGDFFRDAIQRKRIDAAAKFPRPDRRPLWVERADPPAQEANEAVAQDEGERINGMPPGHGIIVHRDGSTTIIGDAPGVHAFVRNGNVVPPLSQDDLARALSAMGRDPNSGARMEEVVPASSGNFPTSEGGSRPNQASGAD